MKQFELINEGKSIKFNFPTSLSEIKNDYLKEVTSNINIADDYVLVALVYHETLGSIIITRKQSKKNITSGVVPVFIKAGKTDNTFINSIELKDKLIVSSQDLMLGQHVVAPSNILSLDYFIKYLDKDNTIAFRYNNNYGKEDCYFVEFKLVPACNIHGCYKTNTIKVTNEYVTISDIEDTEEVEEVK